MTNNSEQAVCEHNVSWDENCGWCERTSGDDLLVNAKIKMLTEALKFYADAFRIKYNGGISYSPITEDQGKRARETLAKLHSHQKLNHYKPSDR